MSGREELEQYLNQLLNIEDFEDYTINGLQVEGKNSISTILTSVSISSNVIDEAIRINADAILVHHGFFWKNNQSAITGPFKKKIQKLMSHDINLFAYHLPLDFLEKYGNNDPVMKFLGIFEVTPLLQTGYVGKLKKPVSNEDFFNKLDNFYNTKGTHIPRKGDIQTVAVVSGGGTSLFPPAIVEEIDAFISGEGTEWVFQLCHDYNVAYSAMGHYKSECIGPKLLGDHLEQKFGIKNFFYEENNPF